MTDRLVSLAKGPGVKITRGPDTIKVVEGNGSARVVGVIIFLGSALLVWSSAGNIKDMTFIFGILLALFGAALATQRYSLILNRVKGMWSYGGDVFFVIPFKSRGSLSALGPVHISTLAMGSQEHDFRNPVITYPVSVEARNNKGNREELRFGRHWSLEEARRIAAVLAEFLGKPVKDESNVE